MWINSNKKCVSRPSTELFSRETWLSQFLQLFPNLQLLVLVYGNAMVLHGDFNLGPGAPDVRFHIQ